MLQMSWALCSHCNGVLSLTWKESHMWLLVGDLRKAMSSAPHCGPLSPIPSCSLSLSGEYCWGIQQVVCHQLHCVPQCLPYLDARAFLPAASQQPSCWATAICILSWGREDHAGGLVCLKPRPLQMPCPLTCPSYRLLHGAMEVFAA